MPAAEVRCAAIAWRDGKARRRAGKGQIVELPDEAYERLLALGDIQVPGSQPVFKEPEATPLARPFREGQNTVSFAEPKASKPPAAEASAAAQSSTPENGPDLTTVEDIAAYIAQAEPNAEATVALADGDPTVAKLVIEAERIADGGEGRKTVVGPLTKVIEAAEASAGDPAQEPVPSPVVE